MIRYWLANKLFGLKKGDVCGRVQIDEWSYRLHSMEDIKRHLHAECSALEFDLLEEIKRLRKEHN
jgi:hypothetical protein